MTLALSACTVGPDYQPPNDPTPPHWSRQDAAQNAQWPSADWWHGFGSPSLDSYMAMARQANEDIAAAIARVREADAQAAIAGAPLLPTISAGASGYHQRQPVSGVGIANSNSVQTALTATYQLDFWGKNRSASRSADQLAAASRFDRATVELSVMSAVASAFFQASALRDRIAVAEDNLASAQTILGGLRTEAKVGIVTALDVAQQETVVANLSAAIPPLRQQFGQALDALAILVGRTPEEIDLATATFADLSLPIVVSGLPAELLRRRPDVAAAEAQLIAANADIDVAIATLYPNITLTAAGGTVSSALRNAANPANAVYNMAASLTQPIFSGGALQGQVDYSKARYDELLANYRKTVLTAFGNVEDSLLAAQQTAEQARRQEDATVSARRAYEYSRKQLQAGTINILTVLNTETALFTAQDALVQARFAQLQALVGLYDALGGGWQKT